MVEMKLILEMKLKLRNSIAEINKLISTTKTSYYKNLGKKLNDPTI